MPPDDRKDGSIVRLFPDRVFGFIYCPADQRDYFFHQAHLEDHPFSQLAPGDAVTFVVAKGLKGIEAREVRFVCRQPPIGQETRAQPGHPRYPRREKAR